MIEVLLFTFGFGMGAMILYFISSKREKKLKLEKEELISKMEEIWILGAIIVLRAVLAFVIHWEVSAEKEHQEHKEHEAHNAA